MSDVAKHRPRLTVTEAVGLAQALFGVEGEACELPSERDQNFLVKESSGRAFVLKIASASEIRDVLELQNNAMEHLAARMPGYVLPRPVSAKCGETIESASSAVGTRHFVRLLTWVPGRFLAEVRPHSRELLRDLGRLFGTMDRAFLDFSHPAAARSLQWDLGRADSVIRERRDRIRGAGRRALVDRFVHLYHTAVLPVLPRLRKSVIHNDGNDYNILVTPAANDAAPPWELHVSAVIDFGDMMHAATVFDLAIAAAYAVLDKVDPLSAATQVVAGYQDALPLEEVELEVLFPLICARLATSVTLSACQQLAEPDNAYLSVSERAAWEALERLSQIDPRFASYAFRKACGLEAHPRRGALVRWLQDHRDDFAPVVETPFESGRTVVIDLGAGSLDFSDVVAARDTEPFTKWVFERIRETRARVGVGRYDEARLAYIGEQYRLARDGFRETRTIHIGIDLFLEPGSRVFAPLDGRVHSFANNSRPYDYGPTLILEHEAGNSGGSFFTLYGHLSLESLAGLEAGRPVRKGEQIARVGDAAVNGGWPPHLHFQIITDMFGREGDFPGVAPPSERELWLDLCPDPNLILGIPAQCFPPAPWSSRKIAEVRSRAISRTLSVSYRKPLHIVRGFMQYVYDASGQAYLDAVNNVPHVGHCHPKITRAAQLQGAVLNTNTRYLHENIVRYAERLCATLPEPLRVCFFVNSGSEANDLALRLARTYTGRNDIVVVEGGYHGNLTSLIEISSYKFDGPGGSGAPPHVHKVPVPDGYRGRYRAGEGDIGHQYADHVGRAVAEAHAQGSDVAAFICESVMSCAGQIVLPGGYLREAYEHVRRAGGVCIADEVQVGFGRVGSHFWAFETQGAVPDIVTMGKPIGNGHPLGAVVTTPEIAESFVTGMEYFNTFGGNPVSCAVGLAVLDVVEEEQLQQRALRVGTRLRAGLEELMQRHPTMGDVRGLGMFLGVELVLDRVTREPAGAQASYAAERMKDHGVLVSPDGPWHNVLKIKPPLVFSEGDAELLVRTLDGILGEDFMRI